MKHFHIAIMVMAYIFATWACTPKATIPSAARLSEKEYKRAIRTERHARAKHKTETMAKQSDYYISESIHDTGKLTRLLHEGKDITPKLIDSLTDVRWFKFTATAGTIDGKSVTSRHGLGRRFDNPIKVMGDTVILSLSYPFTDTYRILEYTKKLKPGKKIDVEIKARNSREAILLNLTVFYDRKVNVYAKIINSSTYVKQSTNGFFLVLSNR